MVGDYNFPNFKWLSSVNRYFPSLENLNITHSEFFSKLSFLNFFQWNNIVNNAGSILDLVLSDLKYWSVNIAVDPLVPCDGYHPGLLVLFSIVVNKSMEYNLCMYNFFNCNYADITFTLVLIN